MTTSFVSVLCCRIPEEKRGYMYMFMCMSIVYVYEYVHICIHTHKLLIYSVHDFILLMVVIILKLL